MENKETQMQIEKIYDINSVKEKIRNLLVAPCNCKNYNACRCKNKRYYQLFQRLVLHPSHENFDIIVGGFLYFSHDADISEELLKYCEKIFKGMNLEGQLFFEYRCMGLSKACPECDELRGNLPCMCWGNKCRR